MTIPILYIFAISHYCEKARWALDHFQIAFRAQHLMIGRHRAIAKKLGAEKGALPFLRVGDATICGSPAIIDWGEANRAGSATSLAGADPERDLEIEQRLDDVVGVHVRRFYYSDALLTAPRSVRPIFSNNLPVMQRIAVTIRWSKIVPKMITGMNLGLQQGRVSCDALERELDWLDAMLADGRPFLTGEIFTRVDITAASLLAPLVNPKNHPTYALASFPPMVACAMKDWADRPIMKWVASTYADRR